MVDDYVQYRRSLKLVAGDATGNGLDLSNLRIVFTVTHAIVGQMPKSLEARIYNPAPQTVSRLQREFSQVSLEAGYSGHVAELFRGSIVQSRYVRDNPTDTYLAILATEADKTYSEATINTVIGAGWSHEDAANSYLQAVDDAQLKNVILPKTDTTGCRPKICYGMVREHTRILGHSTNTNWAVNGNNLAFYPLGGASAPLQGENDEVVALTPATGLIGMPQQITGGVSAQCLLNPRLQAGKRVMINLSDIIAARADVSYTAGANPNLVSGDSPNAINNPNVSGSQFAGLSQSGNYRIQFVDHSGDTRGNDWSSSITCTALDATSVLPTSLLRAG
ncbi:hypothetical protein [Entomobacter blattae]|uniref:Bacteriophage protein n=1 Tax=Entomobacter blattae TaxID=2762277 RepID=A0A7H1NTS7_9PROT|nr:hypothetical protein [Entomobacter blattae]QNT79187.1 hypothetical protein JGUZn3_19820 [Entomobacter blattae]